jgi:hypothetical protein
MLAARQVIPRLFDAVENDVAIIVYPRHWLCDLASMKHFRDVH